MFKVLLLNPIFLIFSYFYSSISFLGVEMSSDEETQSLEKDKKDEKILPLPSPSSFKRKFRFFKKGHQEEGTVKINELSKLYNINAENVEQALPEESDGVESAVDALEESNLKTEYDKSDKTTTEDILNFVTQKISNIDIDDESVINVKEVSGTEIREKFFDCKEEMTVFAPTGFVDLRPAETRNRPFSNYL